MSDYRVELTSTSRPDRGWEESITYTTVAAVNFLLRYYNKHNRPVPRKGFRSKRRRGQFRRVFARDFPKDEKIPVGKVQVEGTYKYYSLTVERQDP